MSALVSDTDRVHSRRDLALLAFAGLGTLPWGVVIPQSKSRGD